MKKVLLTSAAILGVAGIAGVASAATPRVTVGGFLDFQAAAVDQDMDSGMREYGFRNDTEIHFSVDGKTDNGVGYGAVVELEADISNDTTDSGENSDRTYLYLSHDNWGRVEMGGNSDAAAALKVDASTIARATGGIDGDWFRFAVAPGAAFIVRPDLPVAHGGVTTPGATENATKVTYYTPSFSGFQAGVSYTPDTGERGQTSTLSDIGGDFEDVLSGGLAYNHTFGGVGLGLSATGEMADRELVGEDLEAYALGASAAYMGFNLAGSWADVNESFSNSAGFDGDFWTLGGAYDFGPFGASVTYLNSTQEVAGGDNDFDNLSFGVDYVAAPGLTPYAEVSLFEYDSPGAVADNDGTVFIIGTQLAF